MPRAQRPSTLWREGHWWEGSISSPLLSSPPLPPSHSIRFRTSSYSSPHITLFGLRRNFDRVNCLFVFLLLIYSDGEDLQPHGCRNRFMNELTVNAWAHRGTEFGTRRPGRPAYRFPCRPTCLQIGPQSHPRARGEIERERSHLLEAFARTRRGLGTLCP
jgi:hypothetical protein